LRAGFEENKVSVSNLLVSVSFTTITSQHWVLAQEGDHRTASNTVCSVSSEIGSGLSDLTDLLPLIASIISMMTSSLVIVKMCSKDSRELAFVERKVLLCPTAISSLR
jgi:hypothetical protein